MKGNILVVDDEKEIAALIELYLTNDGYTVYKCYNAMDALECINKNKLDLVILDIMLPDIDGFHICQKIREKFYFPVIMLTAKGEDEDKIRGLVTGADDYITKPFNPLELTARVKTQLRRYMNYNSLAKKARTQLMNMTSGDCWLIKVHTSVFYMARNYSLSRLSFLFFGIYVNTRAV